MRQNAPTRGEPGSVTDKWCHERWIDKDTCSASNVAVVGIWPVHRPVQWWWCDIFGLYFIHYLFASRVHRWLLWLLRLHCLCLQDNVWRDNNNNKPASTVSRHPARAMKSRCEGRQRNWWAPGCANLSNIEINLTKEIICHISICIDVFHSFARHESITDCDWAPCNKLMIQR